MGRRRVEVFKRMIKIFRRSFLFVLIILLTVLACVVVNFHGIIAKYGDFFDRDGESDISAIGIENSPEASESQGVLGQNSYQHNENSSDNYVSSGILSESQPDINSNTSSAESSDVTNSAQYSLDFPDSAYSTQYGDMYFPERPVIAPVSDKPLYLTFSNSPTVNTDRILDVLAANDAKATFFVRAGSRENDTRVFKRIIDEGHMIAIQSYRSDFNRVYMSTQDFLDDFHDMYSYIYELTGTKTRLYRFLGGSISGNKKTQSVINEAYAELSQRGFVNFDWSAAAFDSVSPRLSSAQIVSNVKSSVGSKKTAVVLLHDFDNNSAVPQATEEIIKYYKNSGYVFRALDSSVEPVCFIK